MNGSMLLTKYWLFSTLSFCAVICHYDPMTQRSPTTTTPNHHKKVRSSNYQYLNHSNYADPVSGAMMRNLHICLHQSAGLPWKPNLPSDGVRWVHFRDVFTERFQANRLQAKTEVFSTQIQEVTLYRYFNATGFKAQYSNSWEFMKGYQNKSCFFLLGV